MSGEVVQAGGRRRHRPAGRRRGWRLTRRGRMVAGALSVLPHGPVLRQAGAYGAWAGQPYDFRPMLADLRPVVAGADLAALEVLDLAALEVLDRAGLRHAGTARSAAEAAAGTVLDVHGLRVGLLSYAYGLNGGRLPPGRPWLVNLIDPTRIVQDARAARAAGAGFVVVLLHWGQENQAAPTTAQRDLARRLLATPEVDLILGHHVHVVQPIEQVGGEWVAYGMGNSLSNQTPACCAAGSQDGVVVQVTIGRDDGVPRVRAVRHVPTWVEHPSFRVRPVLAALTDRSLPPATRQALEASRERTRRAVGPAAPPLTSG